MMRSLFRHFASAAASMMLAVVLSSCGGGGGVNVVRVVEYFVRIVSPTDTGTYQTDRPSVSLSGGAFVPEGAKCMLFYGTLPAGYQVRWSNAANGASGETNFYLSCLLQAIVVWESWPVPLVLGSNPITVTASDSSGHVGSTTIVVTRLADTTPPTVVSTSPTSGATGIGINTELTATFSEPMDAATLNTATMTLRDDLGNPIAALVSYNDFAMRAQLTPEGLLAFSTSYTATLSTGVRDAAGNALETPHVFGFTTAASPDKTPPVIQSVSPAAGSTCASISGAVTVTFDEDLDPSTVSDSSLRLADSGNGAIDGVVTYLNRTASFTPDVALVPVSAYVATVTTGIKDLAGNALAAPYQWNFTTESSEGVGAWAPVSLEGVPFARYGHVAVWSGSEMIVAGGLAWDSSLGAFDYTRQSGRYDPVTESWTLASGAPAALYQKAVWTGARMLVWGGYGTGSAVTGGAQYDPASNAWSALNTVNQPSARFDHTAVWTGTEMMVWGGRSAYGGTTYGNGARYNPISNTWQALSSLGAPSARYGHTAVWSGSEMVVWGGVGSTGALLSDGARYNPATDTWAPMSSTSAPSERHGHVAVWTGSRMIVWGDVYGSTNTGGLYDPVTDSWTATDAMCAPSGRWRATAVWTGSRMLIWGGATVNSYFGDGYAYNPESNTWLKMTGLGAPSARAEHTAVWTGSKMMVWGGTNGTVLNSGGLFMP